MPPPTGRGNLPKDVAQASHANRRSDHTEGHLKVMAFRGCPEERPGHSLTSQGAPAAPSTCGLEGLGPRRHR